VRQLLAEGSLADAWRAGDDDQRTMPLCRSIERGAQFG
jgi:hypothetical protein